MLQLIKKDIAIHKFQWLLYLAMLLFFMLLDKDAIFIIALMSAIITMNAFFADEQANGHKLWNAMPFTRSEIVSARYSSLLVVTVISMSTVMMIEPILNGGWDVSIWKELVGGVVLIMLSGALCFPIFYWLSQRSVIFVLLILYILLVIAGAYSFYYLYLYLSDTLIIPQALSDGKLFGFGFVIALCLYMLSWRLSIKIYKNRGIL